MKLLAAAIQMLPNADKEANLREAEQWIRRAVATGAKLVVLPEVQLQRFTRDPIRRAHSRPHFQLDG